MDKRLTSKDLHPAKTIWRSKKLLLICFLLLTSLLLSSCLSDQEIEDRQRIEALTSTIQEEFGTMNMYRVEIDDEAKSFVLTYGGPNTIAEYDEIRVIINNFLLANPDCFLNDGYSIKIRIQGNRVGPVFAILSNEKKLDSESNDELYDNLSYMKILNMSGISAKTSQLKGHCSTLKTLALDYVILDDLEVLKDLPQLESIKLFYGYTLEDRQAIRDALPGCEVTWGQ